MLDSNLKKHYSTKNSKELKSGTWRKEICWVSVEEGQNSQSLFFFIIWPVAKWKQDLIQLLLHFSLISFKGHYSHCPHTCFLRAGMTVNLQLVILVLCFFKSVYAFHKAGWLIGTVTKTIFSLCAQLSQQAALDKPMTWTWQESQSNLTEMT